MDREGVFFAAGAGEKGVGGKQNSAALHADKKRSLLLLRTIGFQMPMALLRNGSAGSITYNDRRVNINGVPFSDVT